MPTTARRWTRRTLAGTGLVVMLAAMPVGRALALPPGTRVKTYKGGLDFPVDAAWVPGSKKIFFTEKNTGRVRIPKKRRLLKRPCVDLAVDATGERGALGIALDPHFRKNHYLFVYYTNASPLENRVTRFTVRNNKCRKPRRIVGGLTASSSGYHNGGQLEFVGRHLFVSTGEAHDPGLAQSTDTRLGKILRVTRRGSIPDGNPFSSPGDRSPVWSYGHRNPFGLARRPGTTRLYETENGPSCDDEVNRIRRGRNYGWGDGYGCGTSGVGPRPKPPLFRWSSVVVPTDPWWYRGRLRRLSGSLYVGDYLTGRLHRFVLNAKGSRVRRRRVLFDAGSGILDVFKGPKGWLYFATDHAIRRIVGP
jgi:aldose sugar dehydrogenase